MNNWIRSLMFGALLTSGVTVGAGEWKLYHSIVGNFKAMLPGSPVYNGTNLSVPGSEVSVAYDSFLLEDSDTTVYLISVAHYPKSVDLSDSTGVLREALDGLLASDPTHRLLSSRFDRNSQGVNCLKFHISSEGSTTQLKGVQILAGQQLLLAVVISDSPQELNLAADKFINSLEITNLSAVRSADSKLI